MTGARFSHLICLSSYSIKYYGKEITFNGMPSLKTNLPSFPT
jgi:hypothetical protein